MKNPKRIAILVAVLAEFFFLALMAGAGVYASTTNHPVLLNIMGYLWFFGCGGPAFIGYHATKKYLESRAVSPAACVVQR